MHIQQFKVGQCLWLIIPARQYCLHKAIKILLLQNDKTYVCMLNGNKYFLFTVVVSQCCIFMCYGEIASGSIETLIWLDEFSNVNAQ